MEDFKEVSIDQRWIQRLEDRLRASSTIGFSRAVGCVKGGIQKEGKRLILESELLGTRIRVILDDSTMKILYRDPLERPHDIQSLFWTFVNTINREYRSISIPSEEKDHLLTMAGVGGEVLRGYEQKFAQILYSGMSSCNPKDAEKIGEVLKGSFVRHLEADWALEFEPYKMVRIRVAFWSGDGEIPPFISILYGPETRYSSIPIEDLKALTAILCIRMVVCYRRLKDLHDS